MNVQHEINKQNTTTTWLTPPDIIKALGNFDLDPCTPIEMPWETADKRYTEVDNGLLMPWKGRVWLNPPYGKEMPAWLEKMALHGKGTALTFARIETNVFHKWVFPYATSILFKKGRIHFLNNAGDKVGNGSGAGSIFIAYGPYDAAKLRDSGINGYYINLR